jgi:hypothetical protein
MHTWIGWALFGLVVILLAAVVPHPAELTPVGVVLALSFIAWVVAGVLLTARAVLRFLRR